MAQLADELETLQEKCKSMNMKNRRGAASRPWFVAAAVQVLATIGSLIMKCFTGIWAGLGGPGCKVGDGPSSESERVLPFSVRGSAPFAAIEAAFEGALWLAARSLLHRVIAPCALTQHSPWMGVGCAECH